MKKSILMLTVVALFITVGCTKKTTCTWDDCISGTYKGTVGGNYDDIILKFKKINGKLTGTYSIDDPSFSNKPYLGTLAGFEPVKGKKNTVFCKYKDAMNDGTYVLTFSEDYKKLTGNYDISDEEEGSDANSVDAKKIK